MRGNAETIFVGLSGGVDSSVAALRLKQAGHNVIGVFIKVWQPEFLSCNWEEERLDAMRVAAVLDIPFMTFDAEGAYKREVADYMIREYAAGRVPNPDVMCNQHVKFGAFLSFALQHGADKVATGHYAQVYFDDGTPRLKRGVDSSKDQSYFLWSLTHAQLSKIMFPVGDSTKAEIRKEAEDAGLPTSGKKDSQGICFLGEVDLKEFLREYVHTEHGEVLGEDGNVIGEHDGAIFYTLGQRHGFKVESKTSTSDPYYVTAKDMTRNTVTVSQSPMRIADNESVRLENVHELATWEGELTAQFRYRQRPFKVSAGDRIGGCAMLTVLEDSEMPSSGQSCVIYRGDECLGGGIIAHHADNQS